MRGSPGWGDFGQGDNRVPKLDYMLWHKHISLDNDQNCEKRAITGKRLWNMVGHELGLYACA